MGCSRGWRGGGSCQACHTECACPGQAQSRKDRPKTPVSGQCYHAQRHGIKFRKWTTRFAAPDGFRQLER